MFHGKLCPILSFILFILFISRYLCPFALRFTLLSLTNRIYISQSSNVQDTASRYTHTLSLSGRKLSLESNFAHDKFAEFKFHLLLDFFVISSMMLYWNVSKSYPASTFCLWWNWWKEDIPKPVIFLSSHLTCPSFTIMKKFSAPGNFKNSSWLRLVYSLHKGFSTYIILWWGKNCMFLKKCRIPYWTQFDPDKTWSD